MQRNESRAFVCVPHAVARVIQTLEQAGYPAYAVGGCLRDILRGETPHDWDITTPATPDEMLAVFTSAGFATLCAGIKHGTVAAILEKTPVECTTFRLDGDYTDARHPDAVVFTPCLQEDLARRDFTVNAMACRIPAVLSWDAADGADLTVPTESLTVMDPFGGKADLEAHVLRCVGDPERRLTEDALRILRAVRFQAKLGFTIDPPTVEAMRACRLGLRRVSAERIAAELCGTLERPRCAEALRQCNNAKLFAVFLPEVSASLEAAAENGVRAAAFFAGIDALPPTVSLRLAYLLFGVGEGGARQACRRLRLSTALTEAVSQTVRALHLPVPGNEAEARRRLYTEGAGCEDGLRLARALDERRGKAVYDRALALCDAVRKRHDPLSFGELALDGQAVIALTGVRGRAVGNLLHALMDAVLADPSKNTVPALSELAKTLAAQPEFS